MTSARTLSLVGIVLCVTSIAIAAFVLTLGEPAFDATLLQQLAGWRRGIVGHVLRAASNIGFFVVLGPLAVVLATGVFVRSRELARALLLAAATPIAAGVTAVFKRLVERERPQVDPDALIHTFSMPSGHATSSSAFAAALVLVLPAGGPRIVGAVLAIAFALTVGVSRVALGVHFPTDVLAGWCLGTGVACLLAAIVASRR